MSISYDDAMKDIMAMAQMVEEEDTDSIIDNIDELIVPADDLTIEGHSVKELQKEAVDIVNEEKDKIIDNALKDKIVDTNVEDVDEDEDDSSESLPDVKFIKKNDTSITIEIDGFDTNISDELIEVLNNRTKFRKKIARIMVRNGVSFIPKPRKPRSVSNTNKVEVDYDAVAKTFVEKFNQLTSQEKYAAILLLCGETAASSAKKLGINPANRILRAAKCISPLSNKDGLRDKVVNFYKGHEKLKKYPEVSNLITENLFNVKIYN